MPNDTLTLTMDGEISLSAFVRGMAQWQGVIEGLHHDITPKVPISWYVEQLDTGSATATIRAKDATEESMMSLMAGYVVVAQALAQHRPIPYSDSVRRPAQALQELIGSEIKSLTFQTAEEDVTVYAAPDSLVTVPPPSAAYGTIEGRIQTLTNRGGLRFTLYDSLYD